MLFRSLSNFDIIDICEDLQIKHFKGVFMRDEINSTPISDQESLIINIDHSSNDGTHWTCLSTENNTCVYFDSFGLPPPTEVVTYCNALAVAISSRRSISSQSSSSSRGSSRSGSSRNSSGSRSDISGGGGGSSSSGGGSSGSALAVTRSSALAVAISSRSSSGGNGSNSSNGGSGSSRGSSSIISRSSNGSSSNGSSSGGGSGSNKPLLRLYSTFPLQKPHEVICGHLCIFMLYRLGNGDDFPTVLDMLYDYHNK